MQVTDLESIAFCVGLLGLLRYYMEQQASTRVQGGLGTLSSKQQKLDVQLD